MPPRLAFVLAPGQSPALQELAEALAAETARAGSETSIHVGGFPFPRPDLIYVLVSPHEYFTLMHGRHGPLPDVLRRTIMVFPEMPDTEVFESNLQWASRAGASYATSRPAARAFVRRGMNVDHLPVGWIEDWERPHGDDRDIDVLFIGSLTERRGRALASYARTLARYRFELILSDISWPTWAQGEALRVGADKRDLLTRTKVLINLHQEAHPYLEWLRIVQAMQAGAVVVSEHSVDFAPLVPGRDLLMGDASVLHLLTELILEDSDRRVRMQESAAATLRHELPLARSAEKLIGDAKDLTEQQPAPDGRHRFFTQPEPDPPPAVLQPEDLQPRSRFEHHSELAAIRRGLKDLRLDMLQLRRGLARAELAGAQPGSPAPLVHVATTAAYPAALPQVSIITAVYNHASLVTDTLDSVLLTQDCGYELVVVDDGSTDNSGDVVQAWLECHPEIPGILLRHPVNRGLGQARNSALGMARGEYCFVLDADNELYPDGLRRLARALTDDPGAAFAYGTLEAFTGEQPVGLMNTMPWQPQRLRLGNYIDAMAMIRTSVLDEVGGYATDLRLHGWEDFALWCALASAGHRGVRVAVIVARYRVARHSMLSLTDLSTTDAFSLIIETNPELMSGAQPPD